MSEGDYGFDDDAEGEGDSDGAAGIGTAGSDEYKPQTPGEAALMKQADPSSSSSTGSGAETSNSLASSLTPAPILTPDEWENATQTGKKVGYSSPSNIGKTPMTVMPEAAAATGIRY